MKLIVCIRDTKGRMVKSVNPLNIPNDGSIPDALRLAAEAVRLSMEYGPPIPPAPIHASAQGARATVEAVQAVELYEQPSGKGQGRRGRPTGYKCSAETRAAMAESKRAMWNKIQATLAEAES